MAKTDKKPTEPAKPMTQLEHNFRIILDRILTFQTLAINRAMKERDPVTLVDAANTLDIMLKDKRTQDFIKKTFFEEAVKQQAAEESQEEPEDEPAQD